MNVSVVYQGKTKLNAGPNAPDLDVNGFSSGHVAMYLCGPGSSVSLHLADARDLAAKLVAAADAAELALAVAA